MTFEIDQVNTSFSACSVNRLFGCVTEQRVETTVYFFRVRLESGNCYEIEGQYLSMEDTLNAITQYRAMNR